MTVTASEPLRLNGPSGSARVRRKPRAYRRVAVRCGCWLEHEQVTIFGTTVDLGRGGLFLRTALPMPPGVAVRVTLRLPGSETVIADAKVVRRVDAHEGDRPGLGVRFECLPEGEDSLSAFLFGNLESEPEASDSTADAST
ncbi:MAG: PilZ domain-containing protein [Polyangiales bacterium]